MATKSPDRPTRVIIEPLNDAGSTHTTFSYCVSVAVHLVDDWHADEPDFEESWNFPTLGDAEQHAKVLAEQLDVHIAYWVF